MEQPTIVNQCPNELVDALSDPANDFYSVDAASVPDLSGVITEFLKVVPTPTDDQVHTLAEALGCDYQELERQMFADLAEAQNGQNPEQQSIHAMVQLLTAYTVDEAVMQGDIPDEQIPTDQLYHNDGAVGEDAVVETLVAQDVLIDDGSLIPSDEAA